ncbi:MAG: sugar transferase [Saprospiraceae bacterium]|nr:sugar transferase [Candidatus Defluviibacterium haderslevense]
MADFVKRCIDLFVSVFVLILLSPFIVYFLIRTKLSSHGPLFYSQERIGLNGKPFMIYKFRSMYMDSK